MTFANFLSKLSIILLIFSSTTLAMEESDFWIIKDEEKTPIGKTLIKKTEIIKEEKKEKTTRCEKWLDKCKYDLDCCDYMNGRGNTLCLPLSIPILMCALPYYLFGCDEHWGFSRWVSGIGEYLSRCLCCDDGYDDGKRAYIRKDSKGNIIESSDCYCIGWTGGEDNCDNANPIGVAICCPIVSTCHLLTLPGVLLCCCSEDQCIQTYHRPPPYIIYMPTPMPQHEKFDAKAEEKDPYYYKGSSAFDDLRDQDCFRNGWRQPR